MGTVFDVMPDGPEVDQLTLGSTRSGQSAVKGGDIGLLKKPLVRKAPNLFQRIPYQLAPVSNNSGHAVVCHDEYRQRGIAILGV